MKEFDSITDGLAQAKQMASATKKVVALLTFQHTSKKQCSTCFLFDSVENAGSQLIKLYPNELKITGVDKADMERAVHARNVVASVVASGTDFDHLGVETPGHAEEFLIRNFEFALGRVSDIANVTIYLSHSPCLPQDKSPSNNLVGWPLGCRDKLCELARRNPKLFFSVVYWKKFGVLEGVQASEKQLNDSKTKPSNIAFVELLHG